MTNGKTYVLAGNESPQKTSILIENLLWRQSVKKGNPLFIETSLPAVFSSGRREKLKDRPAFHYEWYPDGGVMKIPLEKLLKEAPHIDKQTVRLEQEKFSGFVSYAELNEEALPLLRAADAVIFVVKEDAYAAGFLYNAVAFLRENKIPAGLGVIISGVRFAEEAAAFYNKLCAELEKLLGEAGACRFLGFFTLDMPRVTHAIALAQPVIKLFPQSGFHGMIKYVDELLEKLPPLDDGTPLFEALAAGQHG